MIFDLLTLPTGPRGRGQKKFDFARPIHVSNSHTKFGLISSNSLGGDSITGRRTDGEKKQNGGPLNHNTLHPVIRNMFQPIGTFK